MVLLTRGVWGHSPPQKKFKFRGSEIAISCTFYRSFSVNKYAEKAIFHCSLIFTSLVLSVR